MVAAVLRPLTETLRGLEEVEEGAWSHGQGPDGEGKENLGISGGTWKDLCHRKLEGDSKALSEDETNVEEVVGKKLTTPLAARFQEEIGFPKCSEGGQE